MHMRYPMNWDPAACIVSSEVIRKRGCARRWLVFEWILLDVLLSFIIIFHHYHHHPSHTVQKACGLFRSFLGPITNYNLRYSRLTRTKQTKQTNRIAVPQSKERPDSGSSSRALVTCFFVKRTTSLHHHHHHDHHDTFWSVSYSYYYYKLPKVFRVQVL